MLEARYRQHKKEKGPFFDELRRTYDGVHVADLGFKKQLWAVDDELDVVWNEAICRWEIWKFPGQQLRKIKRMDDKARFVMAIQGKDQSFRELGTDILLRLQQFSFKRLSVKEICDYLDKQDENILRAKRQSFENYIESVTLESMDFMRGVTKRSVPAQISAKDQKYVLDFVKQPKINVKIFKPSTSLKVARSVREANA